ncbi:triose-phosphate isomerase, partial [Bacillus altitudinis]|uniref:triose-phosphate isomerase n=1 Tax=Bacillus altitudinis TaxID=293387 RepID=UPI001643E63C
PLSFLQQLNSSIPSPHKLQSILSPPPLFLQNLNTLSNPTHLKIPPQNIHFQQNPPFTPQITPPPLKHLAIRYSLIP